MTQRAWILEGVAVGDGDEVADSIADRIIKIQTVTDTITDFADIQDETDKIDVAAVDGLTGVSNSLAYKVHEIERHLHSGGRWFGAAAVPDLPTHAADRIGTATTAFRIDGGAGVGTGSWGAWTQIMGSTDTPITAGNDYWDPHQFIISASERTGIYFIQFGRGASGAEALANGTYTELVVDMTDRAGGTIIPAQTGRAPAASLLWARCWSVGNDTGTIDFWIGVHEYEG